ncbi:Protein argonaute 4 [Abeliophyllum distichum]|uniref:Protein argonaute 4 n=1 Tax=Abeliophyllum distichum TaxID=126358 RepID=A0ABD1SAQ6_9LAMI
MEPSKDVVSSEKLPPPPAVLPDNVVPLKAPTANRVPMARRSLASRGTKLQLQTNHFKVRLASTKEDFFHYSVNIMYEDGTDVDAKNVGRRILDKVHETYSSDLNSKYFAYDGEKSLFTIGSLPRNKLEFTVVLDDVSSNRKLDSGDLGGPGSPSEGDKKRSRGFSRSKTYKVAINFAAKIPTQAIANALRGQDSDQFQEAVRVLDIILRQNAAKQGCLLVRQSFFHNEPRNFVEIGGGVVGCRGFHSSFRATQGGLSLNVDVSTTMLVKPGPVIDFLLENQKVRHPDSINWIQAKKTLKNLRVKATNSNLEYKITGLSEKTCKDQKFDMKLRNGKEGDPETVELSVYQYFDEHRGIKLEYSQHYPCINVGKPKRPIYLPIEALRKSNYNADPLLLSSGISINGDFTEVQGRVLAPPKLTVGKNENFIPRNGRWNFNNKMIDKPFRTFEESPEFRNSPAPVRVEKMIRLIMSSLPAAPQFLLCVLPERKNSKLYGPWKKENLTELGVVTQCIAPTRVNDQYLTNVLLKINAKMGGMNSLLSIEHSPSIPMISQVPTLIVGMDVSHGSTTRSDLPSIAAACKFLDAKWSPKFTVVVAQKNHHTKFFQSNSPDNVPPGTVIDTGICHARNNDFYMCAHAGMIGTTRPTHYHVLYDEIGFSADDLQELVHSLSYV